ncbi:MAG TPA: transglutaminase-like cysteine peptidase [Telluria sp.]|nr:transglutaminase-like cysteine peptidase [Telluria sp.]
MRFFTVHGIAARRHLARPLGRVLLSAALVLAGSAVALEAGRPAARAQAAASATPLLRDWARMLDDNRQLPLDVKLRKVNEFFNRRLEFVDDQTVWGKSDYWATPFEAMTKGKGDCEDFVIAKYFSLLDLDVPDQQLRLIYVRARLGGPASAVQQAHMVLAYYPSPDADPLILDNLITDIRPAARRSDLAPVFSFNRLGVFAGVAAGTRAAAGTERLSAWQDLLLRARREGFD